jgi:hypothetical protein
MTARTQVSTKLMILSILLVGAAGCAAPSTQPAQPPTLPAMPTPTAVVNVSDGWVTYSSQGACGYTIRHPADMDITNQGEYSWDFSPAATGPSGPSTNFIFVSVIPDDLQGSEGGIIYNYSSSEAQTLLSMQVGESKSLRDDPNIATPFTYTRLPDTTVSNQAVQTYENTQPWEFPLGTKEIRYYLKTNGCTYLFGGYMATVGSAQTGGFDEELFHQIIATFRLAP